MALQTLRFTHFSGLMQSVPESALALHASPLAYNMDTERGHLRTASGYLALLPVLSSGAKPLRLFRWQKQDGSANWLVCTATSILVYDANTSAWQSVYSFPQALTLPGQISFLRMKIGDAEKLLIAHPFGQMQLWDGQSLQITAFGSAAQLSNMPQGYAAHYFGRLFCAGNPAYPSRLYWSQVPGGTRSVEDWRADSASPDAGGGHTEIGGDAEPITGLFALSNQLVILKNEKIYRLVGDRPSNYRIILADTGLPLLSHSACAAMGDRLFFLAKTGLYCYDGQSLTRPMHADAVNASLAVSQFARCVATACAGKLWFAVQQEDIEINDISYVYDTQRGTWMERSGYLCADYVSADGVLYMLTSKGLIVRFDDNASSYAGLPIEALWCTPRTDAGGKFTQKQLLSVFCRVWGSALRVQSITDGETDSRLFTPKNPNNPEDAELPLTGSGRSFSLRFSNPDGGRFHLPDGAELLLDVQRRPL